MPKNRREYFRDYKRRQRQARKQADRCIDCGGLCDLQSYTRQSNHLRKARLIGIAAARKVAGRSKTAVWAIPHTRCAECRQKALARLRVKHPLPDLSDSAIVRRLLRRAQRRLRVIAAEVGPGNTTKYTRDEFAEFFDSWRIRIGRWRAIVKNLQLDLFLAEDARRRQARKRTGRRTSP